MSTRGCIARKTNNGFKGIYNHWDSYPTALGATLYNLYNGHFKKDLKAMLKYLIDEHPAGWSTINNKDFNLPPGFNEIPKDPKDYDKHFEKNNPECYCHGQRKEKAWVVTDKNAAGSGCEYAYVFDEVENKMFVMSAFHRDGNKAIGMFGCGDENAVWEAIAVIALNESEPDWEVIQENAETARRSMLNFV